MKDPIVMKKASASESDNTETGTDSTGLTRLSFFSSHKNGAFALQLKPKLTAEEQELLKYFLKALSLTLDEFKLKLDELNIPLKKFMHNLKENLKFLNIPSPKYSEAFIQLLANRNSLPQTLLQNVSLKKDPKPELPRIFKPTPFLTQLKPR